jgi:hypothetical protein
VFVIGILVAPDGIDDLSVAEQHIEVAGRALERALAGGRRGLELVHRHIRAGKVIASAVLVFIDADDIHRIGEPTAVDSDGHSLLDTLLANLMLRKLTMSGRLTHGDLLEMR